MTKPIISLQLVICAISFSFALNACRKKNDQSEPSPKAPNQVNVPSSNPTGKSAPIEGGLTLLTDRLPLNFQFKNIVQELGYKLTLERIKEIEFEGQNIPEAGDVLCKGGQAYAINIQSDGGLVIHIADAHLIAFGYAFHKPSQVVLDEAEEALLKEFNLSNESDTEVLNENFDTVHILVKKYVSKNRKNLQAVAYTHGANRTLTFFDSTKVDTSRLLPSSPNTVGKDTLDRVKTMLKNKIK